MPPTPPSDRPVDPSDERPASVERREEEPDCDARAAVETVVPPGSPTHRCAYCGRPFAEGSYLALHRGLAHADALSAAEREAFEDAYETETAELRRFRIVALGVLVLLYFGFLFAFAVVT